MASGLDLTTALRIDSHLTHTVQQAHHCIYTLGAALNEPDIGTELLGSGP